MDTDPLIFIPFDADGDTSTSVNNIGSLTGLWVQTNGGTRQASVGQVAFDYELALDGVDDYWSANTTLFNAFRNNFDDGETGSTWMIWWRTTVTDATARYMFRLDPFGAGIRKSTNSVRVEYYDVNSTLHQLTYGGINIGAAAGGWQMSVLQVDPFNEDFFIGRNGLRLLDASAVTGNAAEVRVSASTSFVIGRDPTTGASSSWSGSIGPFAVWDRVLSGDELMDVWLASLGSQATNTINLNRFAGSRMVPVALMREWA